MSANSDIEQRRDAAAIGIWENEGGALRPDATDRQFGRRIEGDRSWTVYHVFTSVRRMWRVAPMTGLSRSDAMRGMQSLNRETGRRNNRIVLVQTGSGTAEGRS